MSTNFRKESKGIRCTFKFNVERYNSAMEVVNDCKTRAITNNRFNDMRKVDYDDWRGVSSYEEALNFMRDGYQPTVEKLKQKVKSMRMGNGKRVSFKNNIVGVVPVVPLAMMGVPNNMIDMRMKPIKCKVIDVYYDMAVECSTSSQKIIECGQKLLGAIMELENAGYRFNIYAMQAYSSDHGTDVDADVLLVKVKSSGQPLDLKRISFPLTHTAFFRVIGFDWYSKTPNGKYRGGYGHSLYASSNQEECEAVIKNMFGENAVYFSGRIIRDKDEKYLKEVLEDAGNKKANKSR